MSLQRCPNCLRVIATDPHCGGDFEHQCDSGNLTLDQEDIKEIRVRSWNYQGADDVTDPIAKIEGCKVPQVTPRGNNASTTYQRQHYEIFNIEIKQQSEE